MVSHGQPHASDAVLERVIREHGDLLDRVAWGYSDNAHDFEDLMQEILLAIWRALPRFRGESSERTFVLRIAHNRGISFSMARRRFSPLPGDEYLSDPTPLAEERLISEQRRDRLFEAIRRLPELYRQAVMLHLEGLSQREIAQAQGTSETNVGARLTRARKALRVLLGEEEGEE
ncbi:MAG: RNA polymerase sigma factor [Gemmatimonadaceae bacterium]